MKRFLTEKKVLISMYVLLMLALTLSIVIAIQTFYLKPGQQVVVPGGATIAKPSNNIVDANLNSDGFLIIKYEDGSTRQIGYIVGKNGENGKDGASISPSQAQIAVAVADYCSLNSRCDPKSPSAEQVAFAVSNYCSSRNYCQGQAGQNESNGSNGQNASNEQIMAAVSAYCADGRCRGPHGETGVAGSNGLNGTNGENGKDPVINCVIHQVNGAQRQFVAWKYKDEDNSNYKDLYMLPVWAQGESCITL